MMMLLEMMMLDLNYVIVATIDRCIAGRSYYHSNNNSINLYKNHYVSVAHNRLNHNENLISVTLPRVKTLLLCSPTLFHKKLKPATLAKEKLKGEVPFNCMMRMVVLVVMVNYNV